VRVHSIATNWGDLTQTLRKLESTATKPEAGRVSPFESAYFFFVNQPEH